MNIEKKTTTKIVNKPVEITETTYQLNLSAYQLAALYKISDRIGGRAVSSPRKVFSDDPNSLRQIIHKEFREIAELSDNMKIETGGSIYFEDDPQS